MVHIHPTPFDQKSQNCISYIQTSPSFSSQIEKPEILSDESIVSIDEDSIESKTDEGSLSYVNYRPDGLGSFATLLNFMKGMIGPACLSLPLALRQSGLIAGVLLIFFFGFLSNFCMLQLVKSSQKLSRQKGKVLDYGSVAYEACANSFESVRKYKRIFRLICTCSIVALQIGICAVCYVFMSEHIRQIMSEHLNLHVSSTTSSLILFVPLFFVNLLQTLKIMALLSVVGNLCMIGSVVFILQFLIRQPHNNFDFPFFTNFEGLMVACCSILYSYEGQALVLPMENKIKRPTKMLGSFGVLSQGMFLCTLIYAFCGFFGYATYGDKVEGSIALNLPNSVPITLVKSILVFVIFSGYPIQQYVIVSMSWPSLSKKLGLKKREDKSSKFMGILPESVFRACLLVGELLIAILIPSLEKIIPLIGSTVGMLMALGFPTIIDTLTFGPEWLQKGKWHFSLRLARNVILLSIGLMCSVAGVRVNLENLFV